MPILFESSYLATLLQIAVLNIIASISPGSDFAIVTRNSLVYGRKAGLLTVVGIALGELIHLFYIVLGFGSFMAKTIWLLTAIKFSGCAYLIYLGYHMLLAKPERIDLSEGTIKLKTISNIQAIRNGALTNALNPKEILFLLSIFSVVVDLDTPTYILSIYGVAILVTTFCWFGLVAVFFSHSKLSNKLFSIKHYIERFTGMILILISIKLVFTQEY